ncbi:MAG: hypothetical protein II937_10230 [Bacteroidales bacterium]|nr:hypothetical protein [Bacteroidales bacterium]
MNAENENKKRGIKFIIIPIVIVIFVIMTAFIVLLTTTYDGIKKLEDFSHQSDSLNMIYLDSIQSIKRRYESILTDSIPLSDSSWRIE